MESLRTCSALNSHISHQSPSVNITFCEYFFTYYARTTRGLTCFRKDFITISSIRNEILMRKIFLISLALILLSACQPTLKTIRYSGKTMGTIYNIVAITHNDNAADGLEAKLEKKLATVNKHLSNWDPNSEISRFNSSKTVKPLKISPMMAKVMSAANIVHSKSQGFFDVTLSPLIDLWGFGPATSRKSVPSEEKIRQALSRIGQGAHLTLDEAALTLTKSNPDTHVNLSAIAKGFGVDEMADTLRAAGIQNFMVEIGGDLIASGTNPQGDKWQIGIEYPDPAGRRVQLIAKISNMAMATSGDYRNFFEKDGIRYSHILNIKTGRPVTHKTVSVTVITQSAMLADAWATALLALGEVEGMKVAKKHNLAAFFIVRSADSAKNAFSTFMSPRFEKLHQEK